MKSTTEDIDECFPCLMHAVNNEGLIILATGKHEKSSGSHVLHGIAVGVGYTRYAIGYYSKEWSSKCFSKFNGVVKLQN